MVILNGWATPVIVGHIRNYPRLAGSNRKAISGNKIVKKKVNLSRAGWILA